MNINHSLIKSELKVAVQFANSLEELTDPANIVDSTQYEVIRTLYGTLLEHDNLGRISAGVAEDFEWKDDGLVFKIRPGLKTIDGISITAEDAAISIKRNLLLSTNTHGDLKHILCDARDLNSIDSNCEGISFKDNLLILKPTNPDFKPFLLELLTNADFSVIPKSSIDLKSKDLKIIDFRNTSGPYYVEKIDDKTGAHVFKANPDHFHINNKSAEKIIFVQSNHGDLLKDFRDGKIDLIPTYINDLTGNYQEEAVKLDQISLFKTMAFKKTIVGFTDKAKNTFSRDARLYIAQKIKYAYLKNKKNFTLIEETFEFFPTLSEGSLEPKDLMDVKEKLASLKPALPRKMVFYAHTTMLPQYQSMLVGLEDLIEVREYKMRFAHIKHEDAPDVYINSTDSAFFEDLSMINYNNSMGYFFKDQEEGKKWVSHYMTIKDRDERIKALRALHKEILLLGNVVPIASSVYIAIAKPEWNIDISKYYAGTPFWQVTHK